jgi:hypothetical protein
MAKYISKKHFFAQWWKDPKNFCENERKAALFYEYTGRKMSRPGRLRYPWGKRWIDLHEVSRRVIVTEIWPMTIPCAVRFNDFPGMDLSFMNSEKLYQVWSESFNIEFNLMASTNSVKEVIGTFFEFLLKKHGRANRGLIGRRARPLSFRPVELMDRELQGEQLGKVDRETLRFFQDTHAEELLIGFLKLKALQATAAQIETPWARKSKKLPA